MIFNAFKINNANRLLTNSKNKLEDSKNIFNCISIPKGFTGAAKINAIKPRIEEALKNSHKIIHSLSSAVNSIQESEKLNQKIIGKLIIKSKTPIELGGGNSQNNSKKIAESRYRLLHAPTQVPGTYKGNNVFVIGSINQKIERERPNKTNRLYSPAKKYSDLPYNFNVRCPQGTIIPVKDKGIEIYLPYNYSSDNQYDVLVLLPGSVGSAESWLDWNNTYGVNGSTILDNMIFYGQCDPLIVVSVTYDPYDYTLLKKRLLTSILPYVATQYSTYATFDKDADLETKQQALRDSRDHFAIAGCSAGASNVQALATGEDSSQYFSSYGCFSGYYDKRKEGIKFPEGTYIDNMYFTYGNLDSESKLYTDDPYDKYFNDNPHVERSSLDVIDEGGHEPHVWQVAMYNFIQQSFGNCNDTANDTTTNVDQEPTIKPNHSVSVDDNIDIN